MAFRLSYTFLSVFFVFHFKYANHVQSFTCDTEKMSVKPAERNSSECVGSVLRYGKFYKLQLHINASQCGIEFLGYCIR